MHSSNFRPLRGAVAMLALFALTLAGCDDSDPVSPDPVVQLEGQLESAEGYDELFGSAIVVVYDDAFSVTVAAQGTPDPGEDGHPWVLLDGTCEAPGDVVADQDDLPEIEFDTDGEWSATGVELGLGEPTSLALEIGLSTDQPDTTIACATLIEE